MARCRGARRQSNAIFAMFLVAVGVLLFLSNLGLLPIQNVWDYWPLIFVALGVSRLVALGSFNALVLGGLLVVFGLVFTLVNLGLIPVRDHNGSWPISILFIALGVGGLAKVVDSRNVRWRNDPGIPGSDPQGQPPPPSEPPYPTRENWSGWSQDPNADASPVLDNLALMSSIKRKVETLNFQGGTLVAIWGSIELDLRRCRPPTGRNSMVLDANAIMGSVKLRIPETWAVHWNGMSFMGNFEDKTVPPVNGTRAPQLIMTGYTLLGSIEVES